MLLAEILADEEHSVMLVRSQPRGQRAMMNNGNAKPSEVNFVNQLFSEKVFHLI